MLHLNQDLEQKMRHRGVWPSLPNGLELQPGESDAAFIRRALDAACQNIRNKNPQEVQMRTRTYEDPPDPLLDLDLDWSELFPQQREWQPDAWDAIKQALVDVRGALNRSLGPRLPLRIQGRLHLSAAFLVGSVFNQPSEFRLIVRQRYKDERIDWWDSASQPLVSAPPPGDPLVALRQNLAGLFNSEELNTLCFDLKIPHEDLPPVGHESRARELVSYMERRGRLPELIAQAAALRPNAVWPQLASGHTATESVYLRPKEDVRAHPNAEDTLLELSAAGSVTEQVEHYLARHPLSYRKRIEVGVQGYTISSSEMAAAVAFKAREAMVELKPPSVTGKIHLFANVPAALAVLVGRWTNAVGKIQLYEFRNGEYSPSVVI